LDVKAYIQPIFSKSDNEMAIVRLGERVNYAYPLRRFFEIGINPYYSTDFPIEAHNPFLSYSHIVDYERNDIYSNERIDKQLAWKIISKYTEFNLDTIMINDFIIVDKNIFKVSHDDISKTQVLASIF